MRVTVADAGGAKGKGPEVDLLGLVVLYGTAMPFLEGSDVAVGNDTSQVANAADPGPTRGRDAGIVLPAASASAPKPTAAAAAGLAILSGDAGGHPRPFDGFAASSGRQPNDDNAGFAQNQNAAAPSAMSNVAGPNTVQPDAASGLGAAAVTTVPASGISAPAPAPSAAVLGTPTAQAVSVSPAMSISFAGNTYASNGTAKPDSSLAAGIANLVTTETARIQWYDKNGALQSDQSLNAFFNLPNNVAVGDSRVVYDAVNNRFVVETDEASNGSSAIGVAVSKDSNPNDGWNFTSINTDLFANGLATWADFPGLATDGKAIYLTAQMRSVLPYGVPNPNDTFEESHLWIINDGAGTGGFYDGGPIHISDFGANAVTGGAYAYFGQPAQILSPTPGSVGTFLVNATAGGGVDQVIRIDNPTTSPSFQYQNVNGAPSSGSSQVTASQPGTSLAIQSSAAGNAVWLNNTLYVTSAILPISGPDSGVATAQWQRINTSNLAALSLTDQGNISGSALGYGAGVATYLPTISADPNGDFLVNFDASGPSLFAGSYYVLHAANDAAGTTEAPQALHIGLDTFALTDSNGVVHFGDYNGALDPVTQAFWMFNQYAATRSAGQAGNWATEIGAVPTVLEAPPPMQSAADVNGDGTDDAVWRNTAGGDVSLWAFVPGEIAFNTQDLGPATADWSLAGVADFNGDGKADLLWRNVSGQVGLWVSGAAGGVSFQSLGMSTLDWAIQATGDFSGDGNADILWRNTSGEMGLWATSPGTTAITWQDLGPSTLDWRVQGTGDFNGDGKADVLWRNASGEVGLWLSGPGGLAFQDLGPSTLDWTIQGIGDFTGDGRADILWRNASGEVGLWTSTPGNSGGAVSFGWQDLGPSTSDWRILSVGDFDGNGKSDILWQNVSGDVLVWAANGLTPQALGSLGSGWSVQGAGDFAGDRNADIVWRNSGSGDVTLWNSAPGSASFTPQDLGVVGSSWLIAATSDFTGDGKADLLWRNSASGDVSLWTSTPGSAVSFGVQDLGTVGAGWSVQGAGDFRGDGSADIVWRNATSGDVSLWVSTAGSPVTFTVQDLGISTLDWTIEGVADLTGDGKADILWRNANGEVGLWEPSAGTNALTFRDLGPSSSAWNILAAADFTGDGKADILWRSNGGEVGLWVSSGGAAPSFTFDDLGNAGNLIFQQAADFTGDGKTDILWRDPSGNLSLWSPGPGPVAFTSHDLGTVASTWAL